LNKFFILKIRRGKISTLNTPASVLKTALKKLKEFENDRNNSTLHRKVQRWKLLKIQGLWVKTKNGKDSKHNWSILKAPQDYTCSVMSSRLRSTWHLQHSSSLRPCCLSNVKQEQMMRALWAVERTPRDLDRGKLNIKFVLQKELSNFSLKKCWKTETSGIAIFSKQWSFL